MMKKGTRMYECLLRGAIPRGGGDVKGGETQKVKKERSKNRREVRRKRDEEEYSVDRVCINDCSDYYSYYDAISGILQLVWISYAR